jgi:hypothetical protein
MRKLEVRPPVRFRSWIGGRPLPDRCGPGISRGLRFPGHMEAELCLGQCKCDDVAILERGALNALAVDKGSVERVEVHQFIRTARQPVQLGVVAGDVDFVDDNVVRRMPSDPN